MRPRRWRSWLASTWPLPALGAWSLAWAVFAVLRLAEAPLAVALFAATASGAVPGLMAHTTWRQIFMAAGFPLSLLASGAASGLPAWGWLLPLTLLVLAYPMHAWRDAPVFPTPSGALCGLAGLAPLRPGARVLDAGCGLGAGLSELRREYPQAALHGLEWSWPLRLACAWRCRFARVSRGDIWSADWSAFDMVYVFQRPESMARAAAKAAREMRPGSWLVSLEFDAPGLAASQCLAGARPVWLYRTSARCPPDSGKAPVLA